METRAMRRRFLQGLVSSLKVVWPILSAVFVLIVGFGIAVGLCEGWSIQESVYFSFVTGLTIGYGDFAPKTLLGRVLSVLIGMCGILLTGIVAAIAVKAITNMQSTGDD
jgi:Na+-translocating ferredoxin:NAD+ oxidoreductase RnfE subunit